MPQAVLGIAFSFGIPMAFAAVRGGDPGRRRARRRGAGLAWWLLCGNLFWVLAYDTEYAMVDRDDDLRIGISTSAITLGRFDVAAVMVFYAAYLVTSGPRSAVDARPGAGRTSARIAGRRAPIACLALHADPRRARAKGCFRAFRLNHWLGFVVFTGVVAQLALR